MFSKGIDKRDKNGLIGLEEAANSIIYLWSLVVFLNSDSFQDQTDKLFYCFSDQNENMQTDLKSKIKHKRYSYKQPVFKNDINYDNLSFS